MKNPLKRGPGRPPKAEAPFEEERYHEDQKFWDGFTAMLNKRHADGYKLFRLVRTGAGDLLLIWEKRGEG